MSDAATDREAIRALVDRYAAEVDDHRPAEAAQLFVADGVLVAPAPPHELGPTVVHEGRPALAAAMAALGGFTATFHAVHGVVVDALDERTAAGRVTCTAHHLSAPTAGRDARDLVWHLVYRDAYRRTDAGWRFARRELRIVSIESRSPRAVGPTHNPQEDTR
ncbi:nuclear transport factor 2 family protein [Nocardioides daejeonensis]|uniref:nuclear transport factor 2 family protein n=1 Tax=Nocardioides daejeonensis TaxID=1046556 RepID=UPI0013A58C8A|nr:nuclear transport factor 2 family protein [Nocardioides daejeonensis]